MLLPQRKLKKVESFSVDEGVKDNSDYRLKMFDKVEVSYYEVTTGFFGKKENTWTEKFKFRRTEKRVVDEEGVTEYTQANDHQELKAQLEAHIDGIQELIKDNECVISQVDYDFFKEKFPERFV